MTFFVRLAGAVAITAALSILFPGAAFAAVTPTPIPVTPQPAVDQTPAPTSPAPTAGQVREVPDGAVETGDGSTAPGSSDMLLVWGGMGMVGAAGAGTLIVVRRRTT